MKATSCFNFGVIVLAPARRGFVAFPIDDAARGAIAYAYAVRSFSLAFDLDQQSMGWRAVA
jgi:hypothetical protein